MKDSEITILIQSLIHTSDPGQFGVDKSNETVSIADEIKQWNRTSTQKVELWGLLDGVGFSENKTDTINKLLRTVDFFVQLRTLYKAPLKLHEKKLITIKGIKFSPYYDEQDIVSICQKYVPTGINIVPKEANINASWRAIKCGEAEIYL